MAILDLFRRNKPAEIGQEEQPQELPVINALQQPRKGTVGKIGKEEVRKAAEILRKYKDGKANLENRIVDNEQWYKMRHWEQIRVEKKNLDPEPASAWLFNSIANKHADAMDNFPSPNVLPREESDRETAKQLSKILPVILEQNDFEQTYSDTWWYKLKSGTAVYGVFWNPKLENGLGDIDIKQIDILNIFWEPGIKDIQQSKNVFTVELVDNEILEQNYPELKGKLKSSTIEVTKYIYDDTVDTSNKTAVVDWYYKVHDAETGRTILHYCKFVNETVLYASENDPDYKDRGFYDHGMYPFIFDVLFPEEGTPCGFGYVDVMKDAQLYIDKLNQIIIRHAALARPRYFVAQNANINEEEFADFNNDFVHVQSNDVTDTKIRQIEPPKLDPQIINVLQLKIDELKETSGNRDFSQGGTTGGVTAASAIAALQEAGSKLSRDMIKSSYRAFTKINYLVIELIRQFYNEGRTFRITGDLGQPEFVQFSNRLLQPQHTTAFGGVYMRKPIFDIQVVSQRSSPYNKIAQNELAKELYAANMFNPQYADQALVALEMMDFEGKDMVIQKVQQNGTLLQMVQQMQVQMMKMAQIIDSLQGTQIAPAMAAEFGARGGQPTVRASIGGSGVMVDSLGRALEGGSDVTTQARARVQEAAAPK